MTVLQVDYKIWKRKGKNSYQKLKRFPEERHEKTHTESHSKYFNGHRHVYETVFLLFVYLLSHVHVLSSEIIRLSY